MDDKYLSGAARKAALVWLSEPDGRANFANNFREGRGRIAKTADAVTSNQKDTGFPRGVRLLQAADFDSVFRNGRRSADQWFTILFGANGQERARLGLAIAKKRVRLAHERNRLKRLVRESFRQHRSTLPAVDIVVMTKTAAGKATNLELLASLQRHWTQIASHG